MAIATGAAIALAIGAGATAGGSIAAAKMQSNAAKEGAQTTAQSANYAADLQSKSAAESLAFEKQKDLEAQQQFEATQKANYDQWAARETRMNDLRQKLGLQLHDIPAYSPVTRTPAPATTTPSGGLTTTNGLPPGVFNIAQPGGGNVQTATSPTRAMLPAMPLPNTPAAFLPPTPAGSPTSVGGNYGIQAPTVVRLRAPTGEVQDVPASQATYLLSQGATRV